MALLRARLSWVVTLWLMSHAVTLAAVPFALCCRVDMTPAVQAADAAGSDAADACPLHAHHGTTPGAATAAETDGSVSAAQASSTAPASSEHEPGACAMSSTCTPSDIALESLLGAIAVLPDAPSTAVVETSSAVVPSHDALHTRPARLTSPPPRA